MEILIAAAIAVLTQLLKKLTVRVGGNVTLIVVFVLSVIAAVVYQRLQLSPELAEYVVTIMGVSVGIYQVVLKNIPWLSETKDKR